MNLQEYINSGIIEDYCLGVLSPAEMEQVAQQAALYPEIKNEIEAYEFVLKEYAAEFGLERQQKIKRNIFDIIDNFETEENITAENLPMLNKYSKAENWLRYVKPLLPETLQEPSIIQMLQAKDDIEQCIYWTHDDVPHETHTNTYESFLILEGKCRCHVGDDIYELGAGDFFSIPLFKDHNVEILDGPVLAIVQRIKVA